jgi:hypothetical protein
MNQGDSPLSLPLQNAEGHPKNEQMLTCGWRDLDNYQKIGIDPTGANWYNSSQSPGDLGLFLSVGRLRGAVSLLFSPQPRGGVS